MKNYDKESLLKEYVECGITHGDATLTGDYKTANKAARKVINVSKIMKDDSELAKELLHSLLWHQNVNVRTWAAADALKLKILRTEAIAVLRQIASRNDIGILRFNAEMALKVNGVEMSNLKV